MVVRPGSPDLRSIRAALARLNLDVSEDDVTALSTQKLVDRMIDDPSISKQMLPWPLSALFQKTMHVAQGMLERDAYSVTRLSARKPVLAGGARFDRGRVRQAARTR
ncbi:MAG TPA: hypothetical protein PKB03_11105 [Baekduia sp.]|jgi:hypothetical protein|nr:hypothetical protein [Baekduia sp.]